MMKLTFYLLFNYELGGHVDNSIKLVSPDGAKTIETAYGHCAPVTCLGLSPDSSYLVTGSRDTTVLLWRIHRASTSRSSNMSNHQTGSVTPNTSSSSNSPNTSADKSRRYRIEGPIHVLRGHRSEILCCCVSSDLGISVSSSYLSDVLLHSLRKGRLLRRLPGILADSVSLSSDGVVLTWNKSQHSLSTFTLNGVPIASVYLPLSGNIGCMEISIDGQSAVIGVNPVAENDGASNSSWESKLKKSGFDKHNQELVEDNERNRLEISSPSICFFDLHTLKV